MLVPFSNIVMKGRCSPLPASITWPEMLMSDLVWAKQSPLADTTSIAAIAAKICVLFIVFVVIE